MILLKSWRMLWIVTMKLIKLICFNSLEAAERLLSRKSKEKNQRGKPELTWLNWILFSKRKKMKPKWKRLKKWKIRSVGYMKRGYRLKKNKVNRASHRYCWCLKLNQSYKRMSIEGNCRRWSMTFWRNIKMKNLRLLHWVLIFKAKMILRSQLTHRQTHRTRIKDKAVFPHNPSAPLHLKPFLNSKDSSAAKLFWVKLKKKNSGSCSKTLISTSSKNLAIMADFGSSAQEPMRRNCRTRATMRH